MVGGIASIIVYKICILLIRWKEEVHSRGVTVYDCKNILDPEIQCMEVFKPKKGEENVEYIHRFCRI